MCLVTHKQLPIIFIMIGQRMREKLNTEVTKLKIAFEGVTKGLKNVKGVDGVQADITP